MTVAPKREDYDVVVIGAGPAGLAAAATSAEAGLSTLLLDENIGPGGQQRSGDGIALTRRDGNAVDEDLHLRSLVLFGSSKHGDASWLLQNL